MYKPKKTKWYISRKVAETREILLYHGAFKTMAEADAVMWQSVNPSDNGYGLQKKKTQFADCYPIQGKSIVSPCVFITWQGGKASSLKYTEFDIAEKG